MLSKGDYYIAKGKQIKARKRERGEKERKRREREKEERKRRKRGKEGSLHSRTFLLFSMYV